MYTTENGYTDYIGTTAPTPYSKFEDLAVVELSNYCLNFPTLEKWNNTENPIDATDKSYIEKAIYLQIEYMVNNPDLNDNSTISNGFSIGKYKEDGVDISNLDKMRYSHSALSMLNKVNECSSMLKGFYCGYCY